MALTLESSRHIPCAVSLRIADGTWNVPATYPTKRVPLGVSPPVFSGDRAYRGADAAPLANSFTATPWLVLFALQRFQVLPVVSDRNIDGERDVQGHRSGHLVSHEIGQ